MTIEGIPDRCHQLVNQSRFVINSLHVKILSDLFVGISLNFSTKADKTDRINNLNRVINNGH